MYCMIVNVSAQLFEICVTQLLQSLAFRAPPDSAGYSQTSPLPLSCWTGLPLSPGYLAPTPPDRNRMCTFLFDAQIVPGHNAHPQTQIRACTIQVAVYGKSSRQTRIFEAEGRRSSLEVEAKHARVLNLPILRNSLSPLV